ncbi:hypothetical protein L6R52_06445, partial [Myxococcota bacterium]|nr:hypothetical protein [Myxococcota bacterium]
APSEVATERPEPRSDGDAAARGSNAPRGDAVRVAADAASEHATTLDGPPPWSGRSASPVDRTAEERPKNVRPVSGTGALDPVIAPDTVVEPALVPDGRARDATEAAAQDRSRASDPPTASPRATTPSGKPTAIDPIAASWAQPVLPAGESPWSEVVHPRGTHMRDRSSFPGYDDELPVAPRSDKRAVAFETVAPAYSPPAYDPAPSTEVDPELAEALKGIDKRKVVSGVLVALVIAGLFALLSRTGREPVEQPILVASAANEVVLESDPPGATVVSEPDGEVLGKTPLVFLVAPESQASVFLVATGREPVRLALPERGGLTAKLAPLAGADCVVRLDAPEGIELEGVEADIGVNAERRIPGAAVVRAKPGQRLRGARIVRCPDLGGAKEQDFGLLRRTGATLVRVTAPEGATAYVNGEPIGRVPASGRTSAVFSVIRVDDASGGTEERIVPTPSEADVRMPVAKPKPVPKLLAGEAADAEAERQAALDAERSAPKPKLTKAERVIRARQLAKAGTKHLAAGRITQARESLVECVDLDPSAADCHKTLGMLYRRARATFKAREHFTRYLELVPEAADAAEIRKLLVQ